MAHTWKVRGKKVVLHFGDMVAASLGRPHSIWQLGWTKLGIQLMQEQVLLDPSISRSTATILSVHVELWPCALLYKHLWLAFTVDGDPHFIISVPQKEDAICFNINEKPGAVLRLINDPVTGEFVTLKCSKSKYLYWNIFFVKATSLVLYCTNHLCCKVNRGSYHCDRILLPWLFSLPGIEWSFNCLKTLWELLFASVSRDRL